MIVYHPHKILGAIVPVLYGATQNCRNFIIVCITTQRNTRNVNTSRALGYLLRFIFQTVISVIFFIRIGEFRHFPITNKIWYRSIFESRKRHRDRFLI